MQEILMPKLSDMMEEGKILTWSKNVGDAVAKGEAVAEVETEKVNIEITSFVAGTLRKILIQAGESAPVGSPIALVGTPTEPIPGESAPTTGGQQAATPSPVAASANGSRANGGVATAAPSYATSTATNEKPGRLKASPLAKRLAEEHHLDLATIRGTGPEGRIIKDDVDAAIAASIATAPTVQQTPVVAAQSAIVSAASIVGDDTEVVPLTNMRRTIAHRLQQSMQTTPHFYVTMAMDATGLVELRTQLNTALEAGGDALRISFNDLIVMAVARTLARNPDINVSWDNDRLLRHKSVHLGIAVALPTGLIVPVLRDANRRNAADIAREVRRLAESARTGKLRPDEFSGGTFTISNLGMMDVESFTAIINPPEAAILAVGAIVPTPVVYEGQVVVRQQLKMTLSSDHRAIDGAQAAYFMRDLKHLIEAPTAMLLG